MSILDFCALMPIVQLPRAFLVGLHCLISKHFGFPYMNEAGWHALL
jgi:hypothetical protein